MRPAVYERARRRECERAHRRRYRSPGTPYAGRCERTADRVLRVRRATARAPSPTCSSSRSRSSARCRSCSGELRGMRVAGSEELGRALVAAGGRFHRHSHAYTHDLERRRPMIDPRLRARRRSTGPPRSSCPSTSAAFGPGHPDRMEAPEAGSAPRRARRPATASRAPAFAAVARGRPELVACAILIGTMRRRRRRPSRRPVDELAAVRSGDRRARAAWRRRALFPARCASITLHVLTRSRVHRGQPGRARSTRRSASGASCTAYFSTVSSARATIAVPSTPAGSVP